MKGLIFVLGESFRLGGQYNRNIGSDKSFSEQIKASKSHISFVETLCKKGYSIDLFISTYNTKFIKELEDVYKDYKINFDIYNERIGYGRLLHNSIDKIQCKDIYDFIFFMRIDICVKEEFLQIFDPTWKTIRFPTICCRPNRIYKSHPLVNDMMIFIPKKYFNNIKDIYFDSHNGHGMWWNFINAGLTYEDLDTMLNTYHDSDSAKDWNPLYYIVNREQHTIFHDKHHIFNKYKLEG